MSIRKRLAFFFVSMVTMVVAMGAFLHISGPIIVGAFRQSLDAMTSLNGVREFRLNVVNEKTAISRYLLLDDPQEYFRFDEASKQANKVMTNLKSQWGKNPPEWYVKLAESYQLTDVSANRVATDYKNGLKAKAHEEWSTLLSPKLQQLMTQLEEIEKKKADQADATFKKVKEKSETIASAVVIVFVVVLIFAFILFQSLYRAVMTPLEVLEKGANEFGKGHWDHKINLASHNEFGALANAFNNMAESVKQLQLQAVHLDRMSAVGQLAGGVAHEINNPLTAVLGQTQILLAKSTEQDPHFSALKKIENAAMRCRKIVRGLLDFSRPTQSTFEQIDINETVNATLDLCEADLRKSKVNIEKKLASGLSKIQASGSELQQVLLNLITNAIQAMPRGGTLTLETRVARRAPLTALRSNSHLLSAGVEVIVKDTGVGIPAENITKIFEPFFTTKEIGKGTGLGLAVSSGIVKKHGGELHVESEGHNRGATFCLTLPIHSKSRAEKVL